MDVLVLVASFLTPTLLIAGWLVWGKYHVYYLEKKSSYLLAYARRLSVEKKLMECSPKLSKLSELVKFKQDEIDDLIALLASDGKRNAIAINKIFQKEDKSEGRREKIDKAKQRIKFFIKEQSSG